MARILLGVSGGIAAYKALELVRLATAAGHAVRVVQTPGEHALRRRHFLPGADGGAGAEQRVRAQLLRVGPSPDRGATGAREAEVIWSSSTPPTLPIAPGIPNTLAKLAHGLADDLLTTSRWPLHALFVAPAMNDPMWETRPPRRTSRPARARGQGARARHRRLAHKRGGRGPARRAGRGARWGRGADSVPDPAGWAPLDVLKVLSPLGAPASRSTPSGSSVTAPAAGWVSPSPTRPPRPGAP